MVYQNIKVHPVLFGIAGWKHSGKTTLMEAVIRILTERGWKVAAVKHDGHDFEPDREGTDSWRYYQAGACGCAVFSSRRFQVVKTKEDPGLEEMAGFFSEADVILVEGMKGAAHEKVWCTAPDELPDPRKLADRIEEKIREGRSRKMEIETLMEKILLPDEGKTCVRTYSMTEAAYQSWKELFYKDTGAFFEEMGRRTDQEQCCLSLYVRMAADLYPEYVKQSISDQVYFDTFSDITIWYGHCLREKGIPGLAEIRWLALPLQMKLFRLGRLQFEPDPEKKILHVHIPEGEPLLDEACGKSFEEADRFFGPEYTMYDCESWLLSPKLRKLLKPESNILKFQNRFQVEKIVYPFRQAEERVFGAIREDKEHYPEQTSLQRAVKQMVLSGEDVGIGYGTIHRNIL